MTDRAAAIREHFENALDGSDNPVQLGAMEMTDDEETGEQFLDVVALVTDNSEDVLQPDVIREMVAAPAISIYVPLVAEHGFDYPLELIAYADMTPALPGTLPLMSFRCAVTWAREHFNGNLSLEQLTELVYQTQNAPADIEDASSEWVPEYPRDWRQKEPRPADEYPASVDYEYWTSGSVDYPGDTEQTGGAP